MSCIKFIVGICFIVAIYTNSINGELQEFKTNSISASTRDIQGKNLLGWLCPNFKSNAVATQLKHNANYEKPVYVVNNSTKDGNREGRYIPFDVFCTGRMNFNAVKWSLIDEVLELMDSTEVEDLLYVTVTNLIKINEICAANLEEAACNSIFRGYSDNKEKRDDQRVKYVLVYQPNKIISIENIVQDEKMENLTKSLTVHESMVLENNKDQPSYEQLELTPLFDKYIELNWILRTDSNDVSFLSDTDITPVERWFIDYRNKLKQSHVITPSTIGLTLEGDKKVNVDCTGNVLSLNRAIRATAVYVDTDNKVLRKPLNIVLSETTISNITVAYSEPYSASGDSDALYPNFYMYSIPAGILIAIVLLVVTIDISRRVCHGK